MVVEVYVSGSQAVSAYEVLIARWSLIPSVPRQHALKTHAYTLHILNRAPSLCSEQVKTNDAIGIDMRMHRNWSIFELDEGYLGRLCYTNISSSCIVQQVSRAHTNRIGVAELKLQTVCLASIQRVLVKNLDVKEPFFQIVGGNQGDTGR